MKIFANLDSLYIEVHIYIYKFSFQQNPIIAIRIFTEHAQGHPAMAIRPHQGV